MDYKKILVQLKKRPRVHGYISPATETQLSPIQGLGLFAKKSIPKNTIVAIWGGCVTTKAEIQKLPKNISFHYALELYPGFYLAERSLKELDSADFINHSCSPNCKIVDKFVMTTKQAVKKGEELTTDFSNNTNKGEKFICNCGTTNCKKVVYFD
jgi:uncharacterized protein